MATVSVSMAARSSDLDNQTSGVNIQTEGHTLTPPSGWNGPKELEAFGSTPAVNHTSLQWGYQHLTHPDTWYCLEIQVISTEEVGTTPPCPHTWQVPVVEDMVQDGKSGLTEAAVTGPGGATLFYGWQSIRRGLSLGEVWDTVFMLSGAIGWVGKQAQLNAKSGKPGWRLAVDHPSHHQMMHQTQRTKMASLHSTCVIII